MGIFVLVVEIAGHDLPYPLLLPGDGDATAARTRFTREGGSLSLSLSVGRGRKQGRKDGGLDTAPRGPVARRRTKREGRKGHSL